MKLKKIYKRLLREQGFSEEARELSEKLSDYKTDEKNLIFRAENNVIDTWKEREIRKDRKPRDTGEFTDAVVSELEDHIYTQYPKRSQSKFGVSKEYRSKLVMYADHNYIVFPHKQANIASLDMDSFTAYFEDATQNISDASNRNRLHEENVDLPDMIEKFFGIVNEPKPIEDTDMNWIGENWKELKEVATRKKDDRDMNRDEVYIAYQLYMFMVNIERYFDDLEHGTKPFSAEIIFDGPSYLLINKDFFGDYFVWSEDEWKLNIQD